MNIKKYTVSSLYVSIILTLDISSLVNNLRKSLIIILYVYHFIYAIEQYLYIDFLHDFISFKGLSFLQKKSCILICRYDKSIIIIKKKNENTIISYSSVVRGDVQENKAKTTMKEQRGV